ncbi:MAG TPA: serine/threonine-protein kinase [Polyangia bacterium]|nr:serine/threonine-protein kinase [Polyangia bacterium]
MIGQQFGNYRVLSLLGEGGMGAVYLAEHPGIGRRVAVKVLHKQFSGDEQLLGRLLNEARAANAIRHPNIIEILDSGMREDGVPYLVMELLEGETLGARIRRAGALPLRDALAFTYQTASALGAAHKKGIVHRDLKPDNLFIIPTLPEAADQTGRITGDRLMERIKVLDFGIAKLQMPQPGDSVKTRTGTLMGTPIYMSPEQCRGTKTVDHRSDVYSLGVIFYEMLVGQPPFVSDGFGELVNMHLNVPPPSPRAQRPEINSQLDGIILKMLAKNPEDRYPDMAALTGALKLASGSLSSVATSSPDLMNAPTQAAAPLSVPPTSGDAARVPAQITTFRLGAGESLGETKVGGGKGKLIGGAVALAVVGAGVFLFSGGKDAPKPVVEAPKAAEAAAAPKPVAPAPKAKVTVRLSSDPVGARVLTAEGNEVLGTTPLALERPRGGALKVRLEKDGYTPSTRDVPLDEDQAVEFALEKKPEAPKPVKAHKPRPSASHSDDGPAKL